MYVSELVVNRNYPIFGFPARKCAFQLYAINHHIFGPFCIYRYSAYSRFSNTDNSNVLSQNKLRAIFGLLQYLFLTFELLLNTTVISNQKLWSKIDR